MALDIDHVLEEIGSFGRYQVHSVLLLGYCAFFFTFHHVLSTFTAAEPDWRCVQNSSACNLTGSYRAGDPLYDTRCSLPRYSWEFDSVFSTIITEWDMVCERSILASLSSSIYFGGMLLGAFIFGYISDKIGRKPTVFICSVLASTAGMVCAFSPSFEFYCVFKPLVGFAAGGALTVYFLIASEICGVKHRGTSGSLMWYFWTLSLMALTLLAFLVRDWRNLTLLTSVPGYSCLLLWRWIPESPRWLMVNEKTKRLNRLLDDVARVNKRIRPADKVGLEQDRRPSGSFLHLFSSLGRARQTLTQWFIWFTLSMTYYGVTMSAGSLGANIYLVFFLSTLVEIPGNAFCIWTLNRFGRRAAVIVGLIAGALAAMITTVFPHDDEVLRYTVGRIMMALVAKFMIFSAFNAVYVYSAELMETIIRNVGIGSCSAVARAGAFVGPILIWTGRVHVMLPYGIMGLASLIAGLLCFTLPETRDTPTKEIITDITARQTNAETQDIKLASPVMDGANAPHTLSIDLLSQ